MLLSLSPRTDTVLSRGFCCSCQSPIQGERSSFPKGSNKHRSKFNFRWQMFRQKSSPFLVIKRVKEIQTLTVFLILVAEKNVRVFLLSFSIL